MEHTGSKVNTRAMVEAYNGLASELAWRKHIN